MPYYVQALGAVIVLDGVATGEHAKVEALLALASENGHDGSANDRDRAFAEAVALGARAEIAYEGDELERFLVVGDGAITTHSFEDSRSPDRLVAPRGQYQPTVHAKTAGTGDDIAAALAAADDDVSAYDDTIELPYRWSDRDAMLQAFAAVAPLLREKSIEVFVEVGEQRYDVRIDRKQVACVPLYLVGEHVARFYEITGIAVPTPALAATVAVAAAPKPTPTAPRDPAKPFTTGSKRDRITAIREATHARFAVLEVLEPAIVESLAAAARDPANAGPKMADVRRDVYRYLARHAHPAVTALFRWAIEHEADDVAESAAYFAWRVEALVAELPAIAERAKAQGNRVLAARCAGILANA